MHIITRLLLALSFSSSLFAEEGKTINFDKSDYFYRWHSGEQHEFTPKGQGDLKTWKDMLTVIKFPKATSGELLATTGNNILGGYKQNRAYMVKTDSKPRTDSKPAEHLLVAIFVAKTHMEVVFNRLVMIDGIGHAVIYTHRMYGKQIGNSVSKWTKDNHVKIEKSLMNLSVTNIPGILKNGEQAAPADR